MEKSNDTDILTFASPEYFEPTPNFRWRIKYEVQDPIDSVKETKTLEQALVSNKGNVRWQEVPEFYDV